MKNARIVLGVAAAASALVLIFATPAAAAVITYAAAAQRTQGQWSTSGAGRNSVTGFWGYAHGDLAGFLTMRVQNNFSWGGVYVWSVGPGNQAVTANHTSTNAIWSSCRWTAPGVDTGSATVGVTCKILTNGSMGSRVAPSQEAHEAQPLNEAEAHNRVALVDDAERYAKDHERLVALQLLDDLSIETAEPIGASADASYWFGESADGSTCLIGVLSWDDVAYSACATADVFESKGLSVMFGVADRSAGSAYLLPEVTSAVSESTATIAGSLVLVAGSEVPALEITAGSGRIFAFPALSAELD